MKTYIDTVDWIITCYDKLAADDDLEKTQCEIDNYNDENYINQLKESTFNPRFLIGKKNNKINNFSKTKTDKCTIF